MARLTVTLGDAATRELSAPPVDEWRIAVQRAVEVLPSDESMCYVRLLDSLQALGHEPSSSAVIRQAVDVYLDLLQEARNFVVLREGYQALGMDTERRELVEVMSKRAPTRWDIED